MKLEVIAENWEKDGPIDRSDLAIESSNIPKIHNKYFKMFAVERDRFNKLKSEHAKLVKLKYDYYLGRLNPKTIRDLEWKPTPLKILKTESSIYMDGDPDIIESLGFMERQQIKVDYVESILRQINQRNYHLKNIIDWERFKSGL